MTNNKLEVINEQEVLGKQFRIFGTTEQPLFLAKDVAEWIDYTKMSKGTRNVSMMLKSVDEDEKLVSTILISGQNREMWFLTEDGLYEVLMQSRKPIAKQFKKRIKEILRTIRKTGQYVVASYMIEDPIARAERWIEEQKAARKTAQKLSAAQNYIEEVQPDVDFAQAVQQTEDWMDMGAAAKTLAIKGYGRNNLIKMMIRRNIAYRSGKAVLPMQKYIECGYFKIVEYAFTDYNDVDRICRKIAISQRGLNFLNRQIRKDIDELAAEEDIA